MHRLLTSIGGEIAYVGTWVDNLCKYLNRYLDLSM